MGHLEGRICLWQGDVLITLWLYPQFYSSQTRSLKWPHSPHKNHQESQAKCLPSLLREGNQESEKLLR